MLEYLSFLNLKFHPHPSVPHREKVNQQVIKLTKGGAPDTEQMNAKVTEMVAVSPVRKTLDSFR